MYKEVSKLLLYSNLGLDSILTNLCDIFKSFEEKSEDKDTLVHKIYVEMKRLLDLATQYGFDTNLWHNYLTFLLITNENSFTLTCERQGATEGGSVNAFAKNDFSVFMRLFHFDFAPIEKALGIDCFSVITNYKAIAKREKLYNKNVSEKVQTLSKNLANAKTEDEFFALVTELYKNYGVGMFGLNPAFRIKTVNGNLEFCPINTADKRRLSDLVGYEYQK